MKALPTVAASMLLLSFPLAACGSNSGGDSDAASGNGPIKVMQIAPYESQVTSLPFMKSAAQAAVDEINKSGGVGGRQLKLLTCNEKSDANEALRCAKEAASENVAAVVGSLTVVGAQMMPVLEQAGIASVGADAITPPDATSSVSFLFDAGVPGYAAMPAIAKNSLDATALAGVHVEGPAAGSNQAFFKQGADLAGVKMVDNIVIPTDAIDYTQYIARAENAGAKAIVSSLPPEGNLKLWKALGSSGSDLKVVTSAGSVSPEIVKAAGPAAEGSYVVAGTPNADDTNKWGKQYVAAMKKYQPKETVYAGVGLRAYWSLYLFKDVAETIKGDIDSKSVLAAFNKVHDRKFAWVPSLSFDEPGAIKSLPRVVSAVTFPSKLVNGKFVAEKPFDPFAPAE